MLNFAGVLIFEVIPWIVAMYLTFTYYFKAYAVAKENLGISYRSLYWYPAVLFLAFFPTSVDDIWTALYPSKPFQYYVEVLHILLTHSIGFSNALVYRLQSSKKSGSSEVEMRVVDFVLF